MITVHLKGSLNTFGGPYTFSASSMREIVSALSNQLRGFKKTMLDGQYSVLYRTGARERYFTEGTLTMPLTAAGEVIITPVPKGAKSGGVGKVLAGVAIMSLAFVAAPAVATVAAAGETAAGAAVGASLSSTAFLGVTYGQIVGFGAAMALGGIYQAFMGSASTTFSPSSEDTRRSYIFNNPTNVSRQGVPIPLVFGRFKCGSVVVSSDLAAERIE